MKWGSAFTLWLLVGACGSDRTFSEAPAGGGEAGSPAGGSPAGGSSSGAGGTSAGASAAGVAGGADAGAGGHASAGDAGAGETSNGGNDQAGQGGEAGNAEACSPGQYVAESVSADSARRCAACESGFSTTRDAASCEKWTACAAGNFVSRAGTGTADRECARCAAGTFSAAANATECTGWSVCAPGQYVVSDGASSIDRKCADCAGGSFSTKQNAASCQSWTTCTWARTGTGQPGSSTSDAACGDPNPYRQFGTNTRDEATAIARDASGNLYIVGYTDLGAFTGSSFGEHDAFLRKYDARGGVVWTRQFGTSASDFAYSVAVDAQGNVYVAGNTFGNLEGTNQGSADVFVAKYTPSGDKQWTLQFGSAEEEDSQVIAVDRSGNIYVAWRVDRSRGTPTSHLRKFDASASTLWTVDLGDNVHNAGVAVDAAGNVYVAGVTADALPMQTSAGGSDAYVIKYNAAGSLQWGAQFGTASTDTATSVAVDANGNVFVVGDTCETLQGQSAGACDAFVRKFTSSGAVSWTRQFGTEVSDSARQCAVDASGAVYIAGDTEGTLGPRTGARDGFVRKYATDGGVAWTRHVGGTVDDRVVGVAVDASGYAYVTGTTTGALPGTASEGNYDAFVIQVVPP